MEMDDILEDIDGAIDSVHVRNFFCHDNLEIKLNPNVNFIVGRNGSGKSALLTALVVGLGGRATATNRGSSIQSFIKKGANSATIEIRIKNNSGNAYKHDVYGDYITITRTINLSGGSSYKVKSATGEVISTKFSEVNAIILAHDIQVDNPISVLNQDDARSFHASDPKKLYNLFRKATNLDQTEINYTKALENCNKATAIWNRKKDACVELEKEYKKWKTSYDNLQSQDEVGAIKKQLQNEYYWSEIAKLENDLNKVQREYDKRKTKIEKFVQRLREMEESFGGSNATIEALKSRLQSKQQEKSPCEHELEELQTRARDLQATVRGAKQAVSKQQELLNRERRKVTDLDREINNIQCGGAVSERSRLEAAASAAGAAAAAGRARLSTARHHAEQARANAAHAAAHAERAAHAADTQRARLKPLKQQYRELESRANDSLAVYGNKMVLLCQEVKKAVARGEFSEPPRGPIGAYLKVKEKEWGGALEHIIGGTIRSFCVNSPEDSRKLFEIMGRVYGRESKPAVTCSQFLSQQHDVSRHKVRASGHACALDALHVPDPVVANFLIDNLGLESILLVPDHEDAIRLSDNEENVPMNCSKIVTLDTTEYHPAPNYRSYGGQKRPSKYLQISTAERKRQIKAEIEETEGTLRTLEAKAEELNQEAKQARENERLASKTLQALLADVHEKEEAQRKATEALEQLQTPHHAVLVEELEVTKNKVSQLEQQLEEYTTKEHQCQQQADDIDNKIAQIRTTLVKLTTEIRNLSEEIIQEQIKVDQGMSERTMYEHRVEKDKNELEQLEAFMEEKQAVVNDKIQKALKLCPRVENPREMSLVTSELKKIEQKLSCIRSDGLSKSEVAERLLQVQTKYHHTSAALQRLKQLIDEIKDTTNKHLKFCHKVQTSIAGRVQHCFNAMLKMRNYFGSMDIDNVRGELKIRCGGGAAGAGGAGAGAGGATTTSSLSGGERSYSTVAFIMALWDCVDLPFYFMDECDVFMDNVNRRIVMDILLSHALANTNRQFVFLTPHDVSVNAEPKISIHVMADPRP